MFSAGLYEPGKLAVDLPESLFISKYFLFQFTDWKEILWGYLPAGELHTAGFFQYLQEVPVNVNTLFQCRIFCNETRIKAGIFCCSCCYLHCFLTFKDAFNRFKKLGGIDRL